MRDFSQGRLRQQISFLRRQFLQEGDLPFTDVLSAETIAPALEAINVCWKDRSCTHRNTRGFSIRIEKCRRDGPPSQISEQPTR